MAGAEEPLTDGSYEDPDEKYLRPWLNERLEATLKVLRDAVESSAPDPDVQPDEAWKDSDLGGPLDAWGTPEQHDLARQDLKTLESLYERMRDGALAGFALNEVVDGKLDSAVVNDLVGDEEGAKDQLLSAQEHLDRREFFLADARTAYNELVLWYEAHSDDLTAAALRYFRDRDGEAE